MTSNQDVRQSVICIARLVLRSRSVNSSGVRPRSGRARTWWWGPPFSEAAKLWPGAFASTATSGCRLLFCVGLRPEPTSVDRNRRSGGRIQDFPVLGFNSFTKERAKVLRKWSEVLDWRVPDPLPVPLSFIRFSAHPSLNSL